MDLTTAPASNNQTLSTSYVATKTSRRITPT
jgi:hypothetical protein